MLGRRRLISQACLGIAGPVIANSTMSGTALAVPQKKASVQNVIAETSRGRVRGTNSDNIRSFKGIPYGASTDGQNRFHSARPAVPWAGVRDTIAFGPMCPQEPRTRPSFELSWANEQAMSEDCLSLNIWTPALRDHHKRPVMVWFHGGGFARGSGANPVYDGTNLARKGDVVVVTLNHRLNIFGHLYLARIGGSEYAESGNLGILDLVAALRWMHTNIAEFGGDPANVTIFGQSGGGAKVSTLMAMPQTRGLFHRAIVQSGSQLDGLSADEAHANALTFLKAVDVPAGDLSRLQKLPYEQLLAALQKIGHGTNAPPVFAPVVDGKFLLRNPWIPDAPASAASVPMMIGTTRTETTALIGADDPAVFALDEASLRKKLVGWIPVNEIERVIAGFRKSTPQATPSDLFFAITTARRVRQPAWLQAERKAAQNAAPVWLYEVDWQTPVDDGKWKSPNGLELAFVFDNVAKSKSMVDAGEAPRALAEQMSATWLAFARTGNPNNKGLPAWPQFRPPERSTMVFDDKSRVAGDFHADERQLLAALPPYRVTH